MSRQVQEIMKRIAEAAVEGRSPGALLRDAGFPGPGGLLRSAGLSKDALKDPAKLATSLRAIGAELHPDTKRAIALLLERAAERTKESIPKEISDILSEWKSGR